MQFDINKVIEGEYYPSLFTLGIQKNLFDGITLDSFSDEEIATFVHEYVHYLQDISTTHGIIHFIHQSHLFQTYMAIFQKADDIVLPPDIERDGITNAYAKDEILSFYEGGEKSGKHFHHIDYVKIEEDDLMEEILEKNSDLNGNKRVEQVSIYYDENDIPTVLGAYYICESMAYLIETICFDVEKRVNEWPYNVCEKVGELLCPGIINKPEIIVVLCEYSLMHEHCGQAFYDALLFLKNQYDIQLITVDDVIALLENAVASGVGKLNYAYNELNEAVDYLYPGNNPQIRKANKYVKDIFKAGQSNRNKNHFLISGILMSDDPGAIIRKWLDVFPFPLFIDKISKDFYGESEELSIIPVPLAIKAFFESPAQGCPLFDYCRYSGIGNLDYEVCKQYPWQQMKRNPTCPFAAYLLTYQLERKSFKVRMFLH